MAPASQLIDRFEATFDDETFVADAGFVVPATLIVRLGLEALIYQTVRLVDRVRRARPGRKVLTLVAAILAGRTHIDHADRLRAGATQKVLPFRVMAPSTLGRSCVVHVQARPPTRRRDRRDDRSGLDSRRRPGAEAMTIDLDSTICEVHGERKQAPSTATRSSSGITRCWRLVPTPARCSMPGCARVPPSTATDASSKS